jgi:predicted MFS family arabinose efflux permease
VAILVAVAFLSVSIGLSMPFINVYFAEVTHATTSQIGLIFSVASGVATVTTFGAPALAARMGKLPAFVSTRILSAPCLLLMAWHVPLSVAAAAFLVRNILGNISGALDNNFMLELMPPTQRARASGWRAAVFNSCTALSSYGAGVLLTRVGYSPLFVASAGLTVLSPVIYFAYFRFLPAGPQRSAALEDRA